MNSAKIPVADYAKFNGQFNPVKFNADEWADLAKKAGMKYLVISAADKGSGSPVNIRSVRMVLFNH